MLLSIEKKDIRHCFLDSLSEGSQLHDLASISSLVNHVGISGLIWSLVCLHFCCHIRWRCISLRGGIRSHAVVERLLRLSVSKDNSVRSFRPHLFSVVHQTLSRSWVCRDSAIHRLLLLLLLLIVLVLSFNFTRYRLCGSKRWVGSRWCPGAWARSWNRTRRLVGLGIRRPIIVRLCRVCPWRIQLHWLHWRRMGLRVIIPLDVVPRWCCIMRLRVLLCIRIVI